MMLDKEVFRITIRTMTDKDLELEKRIKSLENQVLRLTKLIAKNHEEDWDNFQ